MASKEIVLNVEVDVKNLDKTLEIIEKMKCCQNCAYSKHAPDSGSLICKEHAVMPFDVFYRRKEKTFPCKSWIFDFENENTKA